MDLLPANAKLGRIMRIMEINIWLLETLFVLSIQIFEGQYFLYEGRKLIAFHMSLQCLSMPKEDSQIDFFQETSFGRFFETSSRETSIPKNP